VATEAQKAEAPIVLRANITRDELRALKAEAALSGMTVQEYLGQLIRRVAVAR
jgi:predicted DNA binding CopG/RHH family protein